MFAIRGNSSLGVSAVLALILAGHCRGADDQKIADAVGRGADFLAKAHAPSPTYAGGGHGLGSAALCGMALLEAGVRPADPAVTNITRFVRATCLSNTETYHVALAILYLDRLGEPADVPMIQFLGVRLYGSLSAFGGWSYAVGDPFTPAEVNRLQGVLYQNTLLGRPANAPRTDSVKPNSGFPTPSSKDAKGPAAEVALSKLHPEVARYFLLVRQAVQAGRSGVEGDNSNTQFGLIGLWVATRHGMPADDAFALIEARFLSTQNKADAGWSYTGGQAAGGSSTVSMTCAGLLGLAVGGGRGRAQLASAPKDPKAPNDPNDPFTNPKKKDPPAAAAPPNMGAQKKVSVDAALAALGRALQAMRQNNAGGLNAFVGLGNTYYMLWSVERVAVAFNLETIGQVDWYAWGCDYLLPAQGPDGAWPAESYGAEVNTAFAILFLRKSNFVRDLSRNLNVKDPGKIELRGGGNAPPLYAPKTANGSSGADGEKPKVADGTPAPPTLPAVKGGDDPLLDQLVAATGTEWSAKLQSARDTKGAQHTAVLVRAIPRVDGERQKQAREALAERLTRMTANTLRTMLTDQDAELRRAACLAAAMKEDKAMIPDLIGRITDHSEVVVRAARAGLKSLTEKDFGPIGAADPDARAKAAADWKKWYLEQGRK